MSIAVGIVAHTSRAQTARVLRRNTGAVAMNVDDGTLGCEKNHIVVLRALMYRHVDWIILLEDDAVPVDNFRFHVKRALSYAPAPIVGLYLGCGNPSGEAGRQSGLAARTAVEQNLAWIMGDALIGSVGYAVRIRLVEPMANAIALRGEELPLRVSRWAQSRNLDVAYTAPSLVDHADGEPADCSLGQSPRRSERRAWDHGTRTDWDTEAVPLGYCPGWSKRRDD